MTSSSVDVIITEHLQPALAAVLEEARAAAELTGQWPDDPRALLDASDKARRAWLALDDHAAKYGALRRAQGSVG